MVGTFVAHFWDTAAVTARRVAYLGRLGMLSRRFRRDDVPKEKTRLINQWTAEHRVQPTADEVRDACGQLVAEHQRNMEREYISHPGAVAPDIPPPLGAEDIMRALVARVRDDWPSAKSADERVPALERELEVRFLRAFSRHLPPPEAFGPDLAERTEQALERVFADLSAGTLAQRLREIRERRIGELKSQVETAVLDQIDSVRREFPKWKKKVARKFFEPDPLFQLLTSKKEISVAYASLGAEFLNQDIHLEDQMFFGVDLVLTREGELRFELEPHRKGGVMHSLCGWQRVEP
jgi:hypothetical protein